jgi:Na+-transporting methylmalonyl-CoA/oxaloacetate decarboxylase gamma subunit
MDTLSLKSIIEGQAVDISITGMSIVFSGLLLLSIFISVLPKILDWFENLSAAQKDKTLVPEKGGVAKKEVESPVEPVDDESNDIASVIGLVLQLELERVTSTENEQITISKNIDEPSPWSRAGRMRKMPQRRMHA